MYTLILIYLIQALICAIIHLLLPTRIPHNLWDFIKLVFLPYLIFTKKENW